MTFDEFKEEAVRVHGKKYSYDTTKFVNKSKKVQIKCNTCGLLFEQTPKNHLRGQGCPACGKEYARNVHKHDYSTFMKKAETLYGDSFSFPNIENEYVNNKTRITIRCTKCGHEIHKRPNDFLNNKVFKGCQNCLKLKRKAAREFSFNELSELANGNEIKPFEGVKHDSEKVIAVCPTHGEYEALVKSVINGKYECKICSVIKGVDMKKISKEEFIKRFNQKYGGQIIPNYEEYSGYGKPMTFKCKRCGYEFTRTPGRFLNAQFKDPCPSCSKEKSINERTFTTEDFIARTKERFGDDAFDFSDTVYTKSSDKVTLKCNKCGRTFTREANSFLMSSDGCPYHHRNKSLMEESMVDFIVSLGFSVVTNDRTSVPGYELDVIVPEKNIAFEFDGIFWHNELHKPKTYHLDKTEACQKSGIRLIHVFEDEWQNKQDICKSIIRNVLGKTENKIYARKCEIRDVTSSEASVFLDTNHIQGRCGSSIRYGLYFNGELVSLMTFGNTRHFIGNSSHQYELLRFCNKMGTSVVGGASRLLKHFVKEKNPSNIVSYADRRWSVGGLYERLGFNKYGTSKPNYFYVINGIRKNRFNFRKSVLMKKYGCPKEMSEREFCKQNKWWRIYDCGSLCYELNFDF